MKNPDSIRVILSLIDPKYETKVKIEDMIHDKKFFKKIIKIAEKNGFYYYIMEKVNQYNMNNLSVKDKRRWDEEEEKLSELKDNILLLDRISQEYGIDYVIIKACNSIPHVPRDIDIFVTKEDRNRMIDALENNGMKCIHSGITETSLTRGYLKIDIYTEICYMGMEFIEGDFLLKSSIRDEIFGIEYSGLNNEANLLLMLVHSLFGHRSMSFLDHMHIKNIIKSTDISLCEEYASEKGWGSVFNFMLDDFNRLEKKIAEEDTKIYFPYLFNQKFVLKCVYELKYLNMSVNNKIFLYITLVQDRLIHELKDTPLYNLVKSFSPARYIINSVTSHVKSMRGDKKSISEDLNSKND